MKRYVALVAIMSLGICAAVVADSAASPIKYEPRSPSFGGNPLNSSHMQYEASSNNQHQDDGATATTEDSIAELVRRSVTYQIANNINSAMFGDDASPTGNALLGDGSSISWSRTGNIVTVTFIGIDGSRTSFQVPD